MKEVDVQVGHVGARVSHRLGGVDRDQGAVVVGDSGQFLQRRDVPSTLDMAVTETSLTPARSSSIELSPDESRHDG